MWMGLESQHWEGDRSGDPVSKEQGWLAVSAGKGSGCETGAGAVTRTAEV